MPHRSISTDITDQDIQNAVNSPYLWSVYMGLAILSGARMSGSAALQLAGAVAEAGLVAWVLHSGLRKRRRKPTRWVIFGIAGVYALFAILLCYGAFQAYQFHNRWFW